MPSHARAQTGNAHFLNPQSPNNLFNEVLSPHTAALVQDRQLDLAVNQVLILLVEDVK